eukprot:c7002_g1_i1 orf=104-1327(+)
MEVANSRPLRVLEFYSGIGGMRYALEQAGVLATVVEAFEINDMANDVYQYNFGHRPNQGNIQHLSMHKLDSYEADAWLLSPPCQPYTRQGLQKDAEDSRASSFLKLLEMLPVMSKPPTYLFIENVVGFECSVSHDLLTKALKRAEFSIQEFILTPLQLGIPYSRPRYFCLAKQAPYCFLYPQFDDQLLYNPGPTALSLSDMSEQELQSFASGSDQTLNSHGHEFRCDDVCTSLSEYLEEEQLFVDEDKLDKRDPSHFTESYVAQLDCNGKKLEHNWFEVPDSLIDRWGDAFDVVTPNSKKCCCFTKSYGRFVKGTGSFLATKQLTNGHGFEQLRDEGNACVITKTKSLLRQLGLRYFTPREIANLHSFPKKFKFPDRITVKQRYALLGNSLSVAVVALLLQYLFQNK